MRALSPAARQRRAQAVGVARRLRAAGHEALLCGGAVRDELLGRDPADYDVATSAPPEVGAALFARAVTVGARFGVLVVPVVPAEAGGAPGQVEVATFRDDGLYVDGRRPEAVRFSDPPRDARRRDFTVNGLFMDPETGVVHDHVGGLEDLRARLVRAIGDPEARFREDHLRILRAARQAAQLGFALEPRTRAAMGDLAPLLREISAERIRDELLKLLCHARGRGLRLLRETGLLAVVLPEVEALCGVPQPPRYHPEGDVFVHTCLVLDGLAVPPGTDADAAADLHWAALLHDVAKPPTYVREPGGRIRFFGHDKLGAEMAEGVLERLRTSRRTRERVRALVAEHIRIASAPRMRANTLRRFLGQADFPLHLALHAADCGASHGATEVLEFLHGELERYANRPVLPPPLLQGRDLLALGYRPGPRLGRILAWVADEQLEGRLDEPGEAARRVLETFPPDPGEEPREPKA